jgi:glyoxylase-like metal-dependent hydrolase (beta-lactamase superfamily II)
MFSVGQFFTNCYVVNCEKTKQAIILDPGFDNKAEAEQILDYIHKNTLKPKYIVNTHGHPDHTCGNGIIKEKYGIPILIHENDAHMLGNIMGKLTQFFIFKHHSPNADIILHEGNVIKFGIETLKVIHTPGHSRGSISLLGEKEIFTGDTLFAGSIGRTDFPESSEQEMKLSLKKLATLPDHLKVYPGHGPPTTIGEEKQFNPFLSL